MGADDRWRRIPLAAFAAVMLGAALAFIGRGTSAQIWDDALFFKRVAYNIVHHGVAAWNPQDGPVFMSTTQLFQAVTVPLFAVAPNHYGAAVILWSALCLFGAYLILWRLACRESSGPGISALLFFTLLAPPLLSAVTTGMETCTAFLVMALFLLVVERGRLSALAAANVLVYLTRPDALLLSLPISVAVIGSPPAQRRNLWKLGLLVALGLGLVSVCFFAYYKSALPLAFFLKTRPFSVYDREYLDLDFGGKARNLIEIALVVGALLPFVVLRRDRLNLGILVGVGLFILFHAVTTTEIMGYHARFYAPALPLLAHAAVRGASKIESRRTALRVLSVCGVASALTAIAFHLRWIESSKGSCSLDTVPFLDYLGFVVGVPLSALVIALPAKNRAPACVAAVAMMAALTLARIPRPMSIANDHDIYQQVAATDSDLVGIEVIERCFPQPFQLSHSEVGAPGVMFLESRIIDSAGPANPKVARNQLDFEQICRDDRPEFIFRPHGSHKRLNQELSASPCVATSYTQVTLPRRSACPLLVRNDLLEKFSACVPTIGLR
jgi:hypothetical protein